MDICVLNPFFEPYHGGTEKVLLNVYSRMAKRHNITVISSALRESNHDSVEKIDGIKVMRLRSDYVDLPLLPMPVVQPRGLQDAIRNERAQLYHINNRFLYFHDTLSSVRSINAKLAITIHNSVPKNIDPFTDMAGMAFDIAWARKLMHQSDVITGVSEDAIRTTVPAADQSRARVIYNGADHKLFRRIPKSNRKLQDLSKRIGLPGKRIITNGRLVPQKGQVYLLRAVSALVNRYGKDVSLLIVGKGQLGGALLAEAKRLGMADRFSIESDIVESEMPYYYNACDLFMLPSLYEPAGLVISEALACEKPTVVSRVGGIPEYADRYALYVKPRDQLDIEEKLLYDLSHMKEANLVAKRGRKHVVENHDWDKISKQYEELFLNELRG